MTNLGKSALALIERDGKILTVYNPRHKGFGLPGGMFEPEDVELSSTQRRELLEETGLETVSAVKIYVGDHQGARSSEVHIFRVVAKGEPVPKEGHPILWQSLSDFIAQSPFKPFFDVMLARFAEVTEEYGEISVCGLPLSPYYLAPKDCGVLYWANSVGFRVCRLGGDRGYKADLSSAGLYETQCGHSPLGAAQKLEDRIRAQARLLSKLVLGGT